MQAQQTLHNRLGGIETSAAAPVAVNGRYRAHKVAGQQRYANELIARLSPHLEVIEPRAPLKGATGHAWEQCALPCAARARVLWSPCQTGPALRHRHVVTFHDLFALDNPEWFSKGYAWWYGLTIPLLARNASHLIAVSEYTRGRLIAALGIAPEKVHVIHSGIDRRFQPQSPSAIEEMGRRLNLPSRSYVLSVSSLEPRKNVARILQAWKRILPELPPDCWLVLAGAKGSPGVFAGQEIDSSVSRVHFTGYVDDALLPALYAGAHAFIFPSLAEGFGFPVLEAMSCGTPSLTSRTSSLPEVTGLAALHVNPLDVDGIARGILTLVSSAALCEELRSRGFSRRKLFDWDHAATQTLRVLQEADAQTKGAGR